MSLNATSAAYVHYNIQNLIEESEELAKDAHRTVTEMSLVGNAVGFFFWALWEIVLYPV